MHFLNSPLVDGGGIGEINGKGVVAVWDWGVCIVLTEHLAGNYCPPSPERIRSDTCRPPCHTRHPGPRSGT